MAQFDSHYFILSRDFQSIDGKPRFTGFMPGEDDTADRMWDKYPLESDRPLLFQIDEMELRQKENHIGEMGDFIISGGDILTSPKAHAILAPYARTSQRWELSPAVLRLLGNIYAQPLYFMHFYEALNVWDEKLSTYAMPYDPAVDKTAFLSKIVLDDEKLSRIPETERMIFQLGNIDTLPVLLHERVVEQLTAQQCTYGAAFFRLSDYSV